MSALQEQIGGGHYKKLKIQPVEYIVANNIPYCEGSCIKYLTRWRDKGGVQDLNKAKHFIDIIIYHVERIGVTHNPVTVTIHPYKYCLANSVPLNEGIAISLVTFWRECSGVDALHMAKERIERIIEEVKNNS